MKNKILILGISLLIIGMPLAAGLHTPALKSLKTEGNTVIKEIVPNKNIGSSPTADEPPSWANGNFTGVWGIDIWGEYQIPIGWMFGYYKHNTNFGYFYAAFANFGYENVSWYIQGYFFGPFMFGSLGENESANTSLFVGIGRYNETSYYWRLMGETGPTFFMNGEYTKFD
ncbi:MAG TPA: hypothetical protein VMY59_10650 [Candidatus Thermoplasmatota archaeon]|nr:hypothetical protein [Candidatus Thermoplasmatota archaeon]